MALSPVPSEQPEATCANCGSQVVADQRYCLNCGQPVSPVRLAFLDVLAPAAPPPAGALPAAAWPPSGAIVEATPASYVAVQSQGGANAWLRRNSGLLGLIAILAIFLLAGLLIGHWVSQSKTPANTTVKIEGLAGLAAAGSATPSTTSPSEASSPAAATKAPAKQEAKEKAEGEHETVKEKAPPPAPKKVTKAKLKKITESTGKKHNEELNASGAEPIETT